MTQHNMQDYAKEYAEFTWQRPEKYNFAKDVIDHWAKDTSKLAMHWIDDAGSEEKRTFHDISVNSRKLCNVLSSAGVQRGDTVVLILGRNIEWWETVTACIRMGAVVSPGTVQLSAKDLAYRINTSGATCIVTDDEGADKLEQVSEQCPSLKNKILVNNSLARNNWISYTPAVSAASSDFEAADTRSDENSLCYFTSGTTGFPKMTIHTHSYAMGHITTGRYWLDLQPEHLHWNISDTGWAKAAWSSYFGPWLCGAAVFVHHAAAFDPKRTLDILSEYPITTMCGAPTIYRMLVLEDVSAYTFPHLIHCVGAGEPLNPEVISVWKKATGLTIKDGYGQTESVILCANFPCNETRSGSMGKPAPGIDLHVIGNDGEILPPDTEGDIAIRIVPERPQGLFKEYKNEAAKTAATFKGDWYITGDRASVDEDGYFWFISRADDVILSAGYRIGPFEVESALIEHAAVAESAVVASPDDKRGEVVKAFVVLTPGYSASDDLVQALQNHVKNATAPYKYPRKIEFIKDLPKTVSGKIRRVELKAREWG
ncbi:MAG: AMP-binding protein [Pseudomonadales bacterium]|nr:AMP-binding protein [Pseudomonadales bacterium]